LTFIKRVFQARASAAHYLHHLSFCTILWASDRYGSVAALANFAENLDQFVNISVHFFGTILGFVLVVFYLKKIKAKQCLGGPGVGEAVVWY